MADMGITDLPCESKDQDCFKINSYVTGLKNFILECPTPMSIAIQGDWGTGKTSMINLLRKELDPSGGKDKKSDVQCVYFNTWQYSQFNMSDDLYTSFVTCLVKSFSNKDYKDKFLKSVFKIGKNFLYNTVSNVSSIDIGALEEIWAKNEERMESVERMRSDFCELVDSQLGKKENARLVIFIDDLDRLNPQVAVELLEVIKLFMDVKKCIFVLAIDYDVVVTGVRSKYGQNVSESKCRSFFDKIIQLPFRMPVESYELDGIIRKNLGEKLEAEHIKPAAEFITSVMGTNPRAFKRLANSFILIENVNTARNQNKTNKLDNLMILCDLCVQMCSPEMYTLMATDDGFVDRLVSCESGASLLDESDIELTAESEDGKAFINAADSFNALFELWQDEKERDSALTALKNSFSLTAITSVTAQKERGSGTRADSTKVTKIMIGGEAIPVKKATEALCITFTRLLGGSTELAKAFIQNSSQALTLDAAVSNSVFRKKVPLFENNGETVYIGTSTSTPLKLHQVKQLHSFLKERGGCPSVKWLGETENDVILDLN